MEMVIFMKFYIGLNVFWVNKVCVGLFFFWYLVKSKLGVKGNNRKFFNLVEWNVRILLDREGLKRFEC